jgi:ABC-2 type transport system ATP-binding protein
MQWPAYWPDRDGIVRAGLAIRTTGLHKSYRHPGPAGRSGLHPLDLEVRRGEVMGYLGPNGAGKTTTLKLLTGLLKPTGGQAWLLGTADR